MAWSDFTAALDRGMPINAGSTYVTGMLVPPTTAPRSHAPVYLLTLCGILVNLEWPSMACSDFTAALHRRG